MEKKVLIVEDDAFLLNILKTKLSEEGYETFLAEDGEKALEVFMKERPSLILLDLMLPRKSGFEFLEEIGKNPQYAKTPVLIISNLGQEADIQRGKALGALDYFVKAKLSIDELVSEIKKHLGKTP